MVIIGLFGKEGINLSGGQRQKLSIVRGLLKKPKILLLDEITSDLDSESELDILNILKSLSIKLTVVIIAHRISTVLSSSNILMMNEGKIVSKGTHKDLISNCSTYIKLYKEQLNKIMIKN